MKIGSNDPYKLTILSELFFHVVLLGHDDLMVITKLVSVVFTTIKRTMPAEFTKSVHIVRLHWFTCRSP